MVRALKGGPDTREPDYDSDTSSPEDTASGRYRQQPKWPLGMTTAEFASLVAHTRNDNANTPKPDNGSGSGSLTTRDNASGPHRRRPKFNLPPDDLTIDEVTELARRMSTNIHASYGTLGDILARHEATLQKRWLKKTKAQRLRILAEAWPDMAPMHRPDLWAWRNETKEERHAGTKYRDYFMWPYINQVDLARPRSLLLLLNARGRHHPSHFAAADIDAINLGLVSEAIEPVIIKLYLMVLTGAEDVESYGRLVCWADEPGFVSFLQLRRMGKQFSPGEGLLILELQERLLAFLVSCCQTMLHDLPPEAILSDAFPPQPMSLSSLKSDNEYDSLAVMKEEAPYRPPAVIDFARISSLLEAKASATRDHLWELREDPAYFADQMLEVKEHLPEMVKDSRGNIHPYLRPGNEGKIWSRVIGHLLREGHNELEIVMELLRQSKRLPVLHAKYAAEISPTKDLPDEFLHALLKFRYYLIQAARWEQKMLLHTVIASPPLRKFFERSPPVPGLPTMIAFHMKPGVPKTETESQLLWLFQTLSQDDSDMFFIDMGMIVDEVDYLMQSQPAARQLVSARLARTIGYLSVIGQCLNQLNWYQPWARGFDGALDDKNRGVSIERRFRRWAKPLNILSTEALPHVKLATIWKLGDVTGKRFYYPVDKRRTKENVEAMRAAERHLDEFWFVVDQFIIARCAGMERHAMPALRRLYARYSQKGALQRTPPWVELPPDETAADTVPGTSGDLYASLSRACSYTSLDSSRDTADDVAIAPPKVKVKTRGVPQPQPDADGDADSDDERTGTGDSDSETSTPTRPPPIPVDARTLKTFRTLFFIRGASSQPGEVSWKDFCHALTSTGLFAAEKLYGSAWTFYRLDDEGKHRGKPIQIHEPHPSGKIPFFTARNHGRRLTREFGLDGDSFVLKG